MIFTRPGLLMPRGGSGGRSCAKWGGGGAHHARGKGIEVAGYLPVRLRAWRSQAWVRCGDRRHMQLPIRRPPHGVPPAGESGRTDESCGSGIGLRRVGGGEVALPVLAAVWLSGTACRCVAASRAGVGGGLPARAVPRAAPRVGCALR